MLVKLQPYTLSYFKAMQPDFHWPADIETDADGKPMVPVLGLKKSSDFALA